MATAAKQLKQHLTSQRLTVAHRRSLFSSRAIVNIRFAEVYDCWNSKNKVFITKAQAWNDELKQAQKGSTAGQINDSDEKIMKAMLVILGKDMELLRKSNQRKYMEMMRPECPYLELRASRPSIAAMVKQIHTKGVSLGTITNSFNRFALAGNKFIYERKHTSSQRQVYTHPDGSVSISYKYVKKGRGELIIRINKAILGWNIAGIVNTQNADNHFFKANQNQILEQPNNSIKKQENELDNKCGQVQTLQKGDATHHLLINTDAIASKEELSRNDPCSKQNLGLGAESEEFFSASCDIFSPAVAPKMPAFKSTVQNIDLSQTPIRQISEEGELYLQKRREDQAVRSIFGHTAKDNYVQRLWLILLHLLYPDLSANFRRKHEETCLKSLKIIMRRTKMRDAVAFKIVALAIIKAYRHFEKHRHKRDKLYSPIGYLNPNYSGGLMDAVQNWIIKGYLVNMRRSKSDSKQRNKILDAHEKGRNLFDEVVKTHLKAQHGANAIFQEAKRDLEKYFNKKKIPQKTQETVRTEFVKQCNGLLKAAEERVNEIKDPFYTYFSKL